MCWGAMVVAVTTRDTAELASSGHDIAVPDIPTGDARSPRFNNRPNRDKVVSEGGRHDRKLLDTPSLFRAISPLLSCCSHAVIQ